MQAVTDKEAWLLFRIAALSEAASWLLLLTGMFFKYVVKPGSDTLVAIGGSVHGVIFLGYLAALVGLWRILRLTPWQGVTALIVSVVPFGTLVFERWLAARRDAEATESYREVVVRAVIPLEGKLLAVQSKDAGFWCLPGGSLLPREAAQEAVRRTVTEQTGVSPEVGALSYVLQYSGGRRQRLELYFKINNPSAYVAVPFAEAKRLGAEVDRMAYLSPSGEEPLRPEFLRQEGVFPRTETDVLFVAEA